MRTSWLPSGSVRHSGDGAWIQADDETPAQSNAVPVDETFGVDHDSIRRTSTARAIGCTKAFKSPWRGVETEKTLRAVMATPSLVPI